MLVDDDEVYLFVIKRIIGTLDNDLLVNSFTDGEQAIAYIKLCLEEDVSLPDIILLDINMPYLDGWGFLSEFKNLKPQLDSRTVTIFMVTSSNSPQDMERAQEFEELSGYVVKPISEDKMKEILNDVYNGKW